MVSYQSSTEYDVLPSVMAQGTIGEVSPVLPFTLSPEHAVSVTGKLVVVPSHTTLVTPEETDTLTLVGTKVVSDAPQY
jgi:hypothetical protein